MLSHHVVTGKGAYGSVTEELVVLNLLLCGLVLYSVKVSIPQQGDTTKHKMTVVADLTSYGTKLPPPPPYLGGTGGMYRGDVWGGYGGKVPGG